MSHTRAATKAKAKASTKAGSGSKTSLSRAAFSMVTETSLARVDIPESGLFWLFPKFDLEKQAKKKIPDRLIRMVGALRQKTASCANLVRAMQGLKGEQATPETRGLRAVLLDRAYRHIDEGRNFSPCDEKSELSYDVGGHSYCGYGVDDFRGEAKRGRMPCPLIMSLMESTKKPNPNSVLQKFGLLDVVDNMADYHKELDKDIKKAIKGAPALPGKQKQDIPFTCYLGTLPQLTVEEWKVVLRDPLNCLPQIVAALKSRESKRHEQGAEEKGAKEEGAKEKGAKKGGKKLKRLKSMKAGNSSAKALLSEDTKPAHNRRRIADDGDSEDDETKKQSNTNLGTLGNTNSAKEIEDDESKKSSNSNLDDAVRDTNSAKAIQIDRKCFSVILAAASEAGIPKDEGVSDVKSVHFRCISAKEGCHLLRPGGEDVSKMEYAPESLLECSQYILASCVSKSTPGARNGNAIPRARVGIISHVVMGKNLLKGPQGLPGQEELKQCAFTAVLVLSGALTDCTGLGPIQQREWKYVPPSKPITVSFKARVSFLVFHFFDWSVFEDHLRSLPQEVWAKFIKEGFAKSGLRLTLGDDTKVVLRPRYYPEFDPKANAPKHDSLRRSLESFLGNGRALVRPLQLTKGCTDELLPWGGIEKRIKAILPQSDTDGFGLVVVVYDHKGIRTVHPTSLAHITKKSLEKCCILYDHNGLHPTLLSYAHTRTHFVQLQPSSGNNADSSGVPLTASRCYHKFYDPAVVRDTPCEINIAKPPAKPCKYGQLKCENSAGEKRLRSLPEVLGMDEGEREVVTQLDFEAPFEMNLGLYTIERLSVYRSNGWLDDSVMRILGLGVENAMRRNRTKPAALVHSQLTSNMMKEEYDQLDRFVQGFHGRSVLQHDYLSFTWSEKMHWFHASVLNPGGVSSKTDRPCVIIVVDSLNVMDARKELCDAIQKWLVHHCEKDCKSENCIERFFPKCPEQPDGKSCGIFASFYQCSMYRRFVAGCGFDNRTMTDDFMKRSIFSFTEAQLETWRTTFLDIVRRNMEEKTLETKTDDGDDAPLSYLEPQGGDNMQNQWEGDAYTDLLPNRYKPPKSRRRKDNQDANMSGVDGRRSKWDKTRSSPTKHRASPGGANSGANSTEKTPQGDSMIVGGRRGKRDRDRSVSPAKKPTKATKAVQREGAKLENCDRLMGERQREDKDDSQDQSALEDKLELSPGKDDERKKQTQEVESKASEGKKKGNEGSPPILCEGSELEPSLGKEDETKQQSQGEDETKQPSEAAEEQRALEGKGTELEPSLSDGDKRKKQSQGEEEAAEVGSEAFQGKEKGTKLEKEERMSQGDGGIEPTEGGGRRLRKRHCRRSTSPPAENLTEALRGADTNPGTGQRAQKSKMHKPSPDADFPVKGKKKRGTPHDNKSFYDRCRSGVSMSTMHLMNPGTGRRGTSHHKRAKKTRADKNGTRLTDDIMEFVDLQKAESGRGKSSSTTDGGKSKLGLAVESMSESRERIVALGDSVDPDTLEVVGILLHRVLDLGPTTNLGLSCLSQTEGVAVVYCPSLGHCPVMAQLATHLIRQQLGAITDDSSICHQKQCLDFGRQGSSPMELLMVVHGPPLSADYSPEKALTKGGVPMFLQQYDVLGHIMYDRRVPHTSILLFHQGRNSVYSSCEEVCQFLCVVAGAVAQTSDICKQGVQETPQRTFRMKMSEPGTSNYEHWLDFDLHPSPEDKELFSEMQGRHFKPDGRIAIQAMARPLGAMDLVSKVVESRNSSSWPTLKNIKQSGRYKNSIGMKVSQKVFGICKDVEDGELTPVFEKMAFPQDGADGAASEWCISIYRILENVNHWLKIAGADSSVLERSLACSTVIFLTKGGKYRLGCRCCNQMLHVEGQGDFCTVHAAMVAALRSSYVHRFMNPRNNLSQGKSDQSQQLMPGGEYALAGCILFPDTLQQTTTHQDITSCQPDGGVTDSCLGMDQFIYSSLLNEKHSRNVNKLIENWCFVSVFFFQGSRKEHDELERHYVALANGNGPLTDLPSPRDSSLLVKDREEGDRYHSAEEGIQLKLLSGLRAVLTVDWRSSRYPREVPKDIVDANIISQEDAEHLNKILADPSCEPTFFHGLGQTLLEKVLEKAPRGCVSVNCYREVQQRTESVAIPFAFSCGNGCSNVYNQSGREDTVGSVVHVMKSYVGRKAFSEEERNIISWDRTIHFAGNNVFWVADEGTIGARDSLISSRNGFDPLTKGIDANLGKLVWTEVNGRHRKLIKGKLGMEDPLTNLDPHAFILRGIAPYSATVTSRSKEGREHHETFGLAKTQYALDKAFFAGSIPSQKARAVMTNAAFIVGREKKASSVVLHKVTTNPSGCRLSSGGSKKAVPQTIHGLPSLSVRIRPVEWNCSLGNTTNLLECIGQKTDQYEEAISSAVSRGKGVGFACVKQILKKLGYSIIDLPRGMNFEQLSSVAKKLSLPTLLSIDLGNPNYRHVVGLLPVPSPTIASCPGPGTVIVEGTHPEMRPMAFTEENLDWCCGDEIPFTVCAEAFAFFPGRKLSGRLYQSMMTQWRQEKAEKKVATTTVTSLCLHKGFYDRKLLKVANGRYFNVVTHSVEDYQSLLG